MLSNYSGDIEYELSRLLVYSVKHNGWVITKEDISNFDINSFTNHYTVWIGYEKVINFNENDIASEFSHLYRGKKVLGEYDYFSIKDLELMLKKDALDFFVSWLEDFDVINSNIKEYKKTSLHSKKKFKGIVNEKEIVKQENIIEIEELNSKIKNLIK